MLDVLCYDLDVLDPYDPDAEDETDEDLDVDGQDDRAREYYDDLDLLPSHLSLVTELTVDSDLEVLQDVHPGWDGSDDRFDPQNWDDLLDLPAAPDRVRRRTAACPRRRARSRPRASRSAQPEQDATRMRPGRPRVDQLASGPAPAAAR